MEFRHLETFVEIVRQGSFWRAAEVLNCAQSTVTLQIQQLERVVGVELFERHGKRVVLSDLGRSFHDQAEDMLTRAHAMKTSMRELASVEAGRVRVGAIEPTAGVRLPQILARYCKQWPRVELTLTIGNSDSIADKVSSGDIDFGICALPSARNGLRFDTLLTESMVLLFGHTHPLNQLPRIGAHDVVKHRILLPERTCPYREKIEADLLRKTNERLNLTIVGSLEALCRTAAHGLGVGIVPEILCAQYAATMVGRQIDDMEIDMEIGIMQKAADANPSTAVQALLHMIKTGIREPSSLEEFCKEPAVLPAE